MNRRLQTPSLASVALIAQSEWRALLFELARLLRKRAGSEIHVYVASAQERRYYERTGAGDVFASVSNIGSLLDAALGPAELDPQLVERARRREEELGLTVNRLIAANRHFGRGFSLGGFRHPRSRHSEKTSYAQVLSAYDKSLSFWQREFEEKGVTLLLNGTLEAQAVARSLGIPRRSLMGARYGNYHYWCEDEFFRSAAIARRYAALRTAPRRDIAAPYASHLQYRRKFLRSLSLPETARRMARTVLQHLYWRARRYDKARGYYMWEEVRFHWRVWRSNRELTGPRVARLSDLKGRPFVFFPLHAEPESSLQQASPEYFFQLGAIASIARDLPAGYYLAVKETYQTYGRRPDNFYDQIREFKNVVLLDMLELGLDVVRQADAVVTITGTAGFEAAMLGKPVISFGRHNIYNVLPHVAVIEREEDLAPALRAALLGEHDVERARDDGARLLQAILDNAFDLAGYDINQPDSVSPEVVDAAYACLVEGLAAPAAQRAVAAAD